MFLRILTLFMLLKNCTPNTESNPTTTSHGMRNELPFDNSSLTGSTNEPPADTPPTTPQHDDSDSKSGVGVPQGKSTSEEVVLMKDDPTYEDLISGMLVHHCHCPGGQVVTRSGCVSSNTSVQVIDSTIFSPRTIPTSLLAGHVSELSCGVGKIAMILPNGSFALLSGGALLIPSVGMFYGHDHYCVSHVDQQDMDTQSANRNDHDVSWKAKVCIKLPINRCCDGGSKSETHYGLDHSDSGTDCSIQPSVSDDNDTSSFFSLNSDSRDSENRPIVMFGTNPVEWDYTQSLPRHLTCPLGKSVVEQEVTDNRNIQLSYSREGSTMTWNILTNTHIDFWHDEFCLDRKGVDGNYKYFTKFCHYDGKEQSAAEKIQSPPYVRKCCSENTIYKVAKQSCEAPSTNNQMWIDNLYKDVQWDLLYGFYYNDDEDGPSNSSLGAALNLQGPIDSTLDPLEYEQPSIGLARIPLMWGFPSCSWHNINISAVDWSLLPDGSVSVGDSTLDTSGFCFETFVTPSNSSVLSLVLCHSPDPPSGACSWSSALLVPLMAVSSIFMALTLLIFLSVPDLTDRVSSRCLVSEIVALLVSFMLLIVAHTWHSIYGSVYCVLLGTLSHAAALASFFWLNAICIEVWITIRRVNPEPRIQSHRRFTAYCCWGWGAPSMVALLGALADTLPPHHGLLRPQTAVACFPNKDNRAAHWAYVYAPMAALLCVNLALFVHLSVTIVRTTRRMARIRARPPSHDTAHYWNKIKTYLKLFLVMGVSWTAEVLSFQFKSCSVWILTDSFNALRGVFIFFIFVFKAEVLEKVRKSAKERWSEILGRSRQVLTALRGRYQDDDIHSRTNGKGVPVTLSLLSPSPTPRTGQSNSTPATTPTSFVSAPPDFSIVTPYATKHTLNGVHPILNGVHPTLNGVHPTLNGVHPITNGVHPITNGVHPITNGVHPITNGVHPITNGVDPITNGVDPITNGVDPIPNGEDQTPHPTGVFVVDQLGGFPTDPTSSGDRYKVEDGSAQTNGYPSPTTVSFLRKPPQSGRSKGGSKRSSSHKVAPLRNAPSSGVSTLRSAPQNGVPSLISAPSSGMVPLNSAPSSGQVVPLNSGPPCGVERPLRCPLADLSPECSISSNLLHSKSNPSLQLLSGDPWTSSSDRTVASLQRPLSVYSRHMNSVE